MRRFAQIDSDSIVRQVIVADSLDWCQENIGGVWLETFKDRSRRFNYAAPGFKYDPDRDAFIPPRRYDSWVLDESTCSWVAPIPMPEDDKRYKWDEESGFWVEVVD